MIEDALIDNKIAEQIHRNETYVPETKDPYIKFAPGSINRDEIILIVGNRGNDWSKLPLTEQFRKKYNEKDGVFYNMDYDEVRYEAPNCDIETYILPYYTHTKNNINEFCICMYKEYPHYFCNLIIYEILYKDNLVDDIIINRVVKLIENGQNVLEPGMLVVNEDTFLANCNNFTYERASQFVPTTEKYKKKYPIFLKHFIHYSRPRYNTIEFVKEKSDYSKLKAYYKVISHLEHKERHYVVKFKINEEGKFDDADVALVGEYERHYNLQGGIPNIDRIFYRNGFWPEGLNYISENIRKKFKPEDGIFPDIDLLDLDFKNFHDDRFYQGGCYKDIGEINSYKFKDGTEQYYLEKIVYNEKFEIMDAFYIKLPYQNMPVEKVFELYEKEYGDKTVEDWLNELEKQDYNVVK